MSFRLWASIWNSDTLFFYFSIYSSRLIILDSCFATMRLLSRSEICEFRIEWVSSSCLRARISFIALVFYFSSSRIFCLWRVTSFSCSFIISLEILDCEWDWLPLSDLYLSLLSSNALFLVFRLLWKDLLDTLEP